MKWLAFCLLHELEDIVHKTGGYIFGYYSIDNNPAVQQRLQKIKGVQLTFLLKDKLLSIQSLKNTILPNKTKIMLKHVLTELECLSDFAVYFPKPYSIEMLIDNLIVRLLYFFNTKEFRAVQFLIGQGLSLCEAIMLLPETL